MARSCRFGRHEGANIAFMGEILAPCLSGGRFGFEDEAYKYPGALTCSTGEFVLLIDPTRGGGNELFARMDFLLEHFQATGIRRFPGERRHKNRNAAGANGIDVPRATLEKIDELLN